MPVANWMIQVNPKAEPKEQECRTLIGMAKQGVQIATEQI